PMPIIENSSTPPFRLATALPETAAGMDGTRGVSAASSKMAQMTENRVKQSFLIAEILRLWGIAAKLPRVASGWRSGSPLRFRVTTKRNGALAPGHLSGWKPFNCCAGFAAVNRCATPKRLNLKFHLLDKTLSHSVNEIGISGSLSVGAHVAG